MMPADTSIVTIPLVVTSILRRMFHVKAWGLPYSALLSGARLVLPGGNLGGDAIYRLCTSTGVTVAAGVPTVWKALLEYMSSRNLHFDALKRAVIGGAACPPQMIEDLGDRGIVVFHAGSRPKFPCSAPWVD
ncbi:AMP-binding protein [Paraburkholderia sp. J10-1]|uniref:AMP-binding protein n=1 Tax=Paraburkholderia sp. J10-1 TaxID=2805430 RepID=UPI002AB61184|nr:AMP-binding protein [Paraburkholderia sp. J10-1]